MIYKLYKRAKHNPFYYNFILETNPKAPGYKRYGLRNIESLRNISNEKDLDADCEPLPSTRDVNEIHDYVFIAKGTLLDIKNDYPELFI